MRKSFLAICFSMLLGGCGSGDSGGGAPPANTGLTDPNPFNLSNQDAMRFLRQATFGADADDMDELKSLGYEAWIDSQRTLNPSLQLPYMNSLAAPENNFEGQTNRIDAWFQNVLTKDDQLRQRVAFAFSEIMVVSQNSALFNTPRGLASYYDMLSRNALGNFRELIEEVTLHPAMGVYLSMLGNEKPDVDRNIRPDENYARESMQLFTIGLIELNLDGSPRLNSLGEEIPTYDQSIIEEFAHVYTGWVTGGSLGFYNRSNNYTIPMKAFPEFHDTGEKRLLNGLVLEAGQTPEEDLEAALDNVFNHDNVAPFISRQLIQRLVSANPSPDYIRRVASTFNDDGSGVRGNLFAVVKAILLDEEARVIQSGEYSGKLVEPIIRLTEVWRAYDASATNGRYIFPVPEVWFAQAPLRAPSVFNFFSPGYAPAGEIKNLGLVSPEMGITNETTTASTNNYLAWSIYLRNSSSEDLEPQSIFIDIESELPFAGNADELVSRVAARLTGGSISDALREQAVSMVELFPQGSEAFRVAEAINTIAASPEYATLQ